MNVRALLPLSLAFAASLAAAEVPRIVAAAEVLPRIVAVGPGGQVVGRMLGPDQLLLSIDGKLYGTQLQPFQSDAFRILYDRMIWARGTLYFTDADCKGVIFGMQTTPYGAPAMVVVYTFFENAPRYYGYRLSGTASFPNEFKSRMVGSTANCENGSFGGWASTVTGDPVDLTKYGLNFTLK